MGKNELLEAILESIPGVLVTDIHGRISYINEGYAKLLGAAVKDVLGKDAKEVIPGTRMQIVAQTGQEEVGALFKLKNEETVFVNRYPIKKNGKIIGAIAFSAFCKSGQFTTISNLQKVRQLAEEVGRYKKELSKLRGAKYSLEQIIGESPDIVKTKELIKKAAQTKSTVLITGETGTGKELVAHAIHQLSGRSHNPFIRVNCAAIPSELMESELFGYEEGAFTGSRKGGKLGKFELANRGTLLLDEVNQMPLFLQSKLLRVIQEKEIEKVGGAGSIDVDVRLIFTTNQDLFQLVKEGKFREDLYYRINVVVIETPPLRTRMEDLPLLVPHFISKLNYDLGLSISGVSPDVINLFSSYNWPGNIRELQNTLERAANIAISGVLGIEHFEGLLLRQIHSRQKQVDKADLVSAREQAEKELILSTMKQTGGKVAKAAAILGIHRSVLYEKIKKYGLKPCEKTCTSNVIN